MSNLEWNKVTWYSKLLALILFVALPFLFFYYGTQYGETVFYIQQNAPTSTAVTSMGSGYYNDPAEWQNDTNNTKGGFSISYPTDFSYADNYPATPSTDWRINSNNEPGVKYFTLTVPPSFEPQTNFADATLTVGASGNNGAVSQCMTPDQSGGSVTATSSVTINGIPFIVFKSNSAGAGSIYETTSYRMLHAGQCYAIEYTVHSSQIANWPSSYNLQPFSESQIDSLMNTIVGTFKFL